MKVMRPWKKGKKIRRGWVAPKKRRRNARGESRHTPEISRGCVGGANRGVIFFLSHEDRLTRKNPFLLGWKEGTGRKKRGKETRRDRGRRKEGKEPARGKEGVQTAREIYKKRIKRRMFFHGGEKGSFDPWDTILSVK